LAPSIPAALAQQEGERPGDGWPFRLFEVSVADEHRLPAKGEGDVIHARSFRVEREVLLDELLGPRAAEIARVVDEIRRYPWLRTSGRPNAEERLGPLFLEHNLALLAYGPTPRTSIVLINGWLGARESAGKVDTPLLSALAAIRPLMPVLKADGAPWAAAGMAFRAAAFAAFDGAWHGGWDAASAAITAGWDDIHAKARILVPGSSAEAVTAFQQRAAEGTAAAMRGAREASWKAARRIARPALEITLAEVPPPDEMYRDAVAQGLAAFRARMQPRAKKGSRPVPDEHPAEHIVTEYLLYTSRVVFALALGAAYHAGWHVAHLAKDADLPDPWKPLLEVWALGGWPIGRVNGQPHVFLPRPRN
jgi:hypothetical protein